MTPLQGGGQYCDACKPAPARPVRAQVTVSTAPPEVSETGECSNCGQEVQPNEICDCVTIVKARTDVHFGGFFVRAAAFCVDWLVLGAIGIVSAFVTNSFIAAGFAMIAAGFVCSVGFWLADGATPGKMLFHLKVRMINGEELDPVAAVIRYFTYLGSGLLLGAGFFAMLFNDERRGFHDMISNTIVIVDEAQ